MYKKLLRTHLYISKLWMFMRLKLQVKMYGKSYVLVIPKALVVLKKIKPGDSLEVKFKE